MDGIAFFCEGDGLLIASFKAPPATTLSPTKCMATGFTRRGYSNLTWMPQLEANTLVVHQTKQKTHCAP